MILVADIDIAVEILIVEQLGCSFEIRYEGIELVRLHSFLEPNQRLERYA